MILIYFIYYIVFSSLVRKKMKNDFIKVENNES